jgi:hypothetical protein
MKSGVNNDSPSERGTGRGQGLGSPGGQGLGGGAPGRGGHATLPSEDPHPQQKIRFVPPREATKVAAGQPRAPPPRQQHLESGDEVKV